MPPLTPANERIIESVASAVYSQPDPTADLALFEALVAAVGQRPKLPTESPADKPAGSKSQMLGADTTGLEVSWTLKLDPIPTGIYHLLHPEQEPLVEVKVKNASRTGTRRVCIRVFLEGLSAQAVRSTELAREKSITVPLLPMIPPERARRLREVQWATLHVMVEDLDSKRIECHETRPVLCLGRSCGLPSSLFADLSHYYGAWVTPNAEPVQVLLREAADRMPGKRVLGYAKHTGSGTADSAPASEDPVRAQVRALYEALKDKKLAYVRSSVALGAGADAPLQRARLPRETLRRKSANCLDGTLLLASLLEAAALDPALVFVPGHAFVGWADSPAGDEMSYLETTMLAAAEFDAACRSAHTQFEKWDVQGLARVQTLSKLRAKRIWPME